MKIGFYSDFVLGDEITLDKKLQEKLMCTDINVLNLECTLFTGVKKSKKNSICLYSKAKDLSFFKDNNFRMVSIANNHIMDFGVPGLRETLCKLEHEKIQFFGAGMREDEAYQPCILLDEHNNRIAIFGFCSEYIGATSAKGNTRAGVAGIQTKKIKAYLQEYKEFEYRIAYFHFGAEYENFPEPYMKRIVEELLEEDYLDIILGSHPHCVQGVFSRIINNKKKICYYSMGNFIFPEEEYYNGTLQFPDKSHFGFGIIYDTITEKIDLVPYSLDSYGKKAVLFDKENLTQKIHQYSQPLVLDYKEYRNFYKKNRNNKRRQMLTANEAVNNIINVIYKIYYKIIYVIKKNIKILLRKFGVEIVSNINTGKRSIKRISSKEVL